SIFLRCGRGVRAPGHWLGIITPPEAGAAAARASGASLALKPRALNPRVNRGPSATIAKSPRDPRRGCAAPVEKTFGERFRYARGTGRASGGGGSPHPVGENEAATEEEQGSYSVLGRRRS